MVEGSTGEAVFHKDPISTVLSLKTPWGDTGPIMSGSAVALQNILFA